MVAPLAPVMSEVHQGSVYGPCCSFCLFMACQCTYPLNQQPDYLQIIAYYSGPKRDESDARDIQYDLDRLQQWEKDWLMELHPQKCQVLHITSK